MDKKRIRVGKGKEKRRKEQNKTTGRKKKIKAARVGLLFM
jgi:hypothetical protein